MTIGARVVLDRQQFADDDVSLEKVESALVRILDVSVGSEFGPIDFPLPEAELRQGKAELIPDSFF